jgi:hypothetical protein
MRGNNYVSGLGPRLVNNDNQMSFWLLHWWFLYVRVIVVMSDMRCQGPERLFPEPKPNKEVNRYP